MGCCGVIPASGIGPLEIGVVLVLLTVLALLVLAIIALVKFIRR